MELLTDRARHFDTTGDFRLRRRSFDSRAYGFVAVSSGCAFELLFPKRGLRNRGTTTRCVAMSKDKIARFGVSLSRSLLKQLDQKRDTGDTVPGPPSIRYGLEISNFYTPTEVM
jgi:hypothetical protein